jgi:mannose-1-phosphate guanylyltransferase
MPGAHVLGDESNVHLKAATGLVVPASGRVVAVIGLDDVVVVDTPDALLVMTRERAQDVKAIVAALKEQGRTDLV